MSRVFFVFTNVFLLSFTLVLSGCKPAGEQVIRVGGIWDLSGPTSDVAIPYSEGERDYIAYVNKQGGINGRKVKIFYEDYAYNITLAREVYDRLVREHRVIAILGWGTGDSLALRPRVAADKIPFFSCSYAEGLASIKEAPYNFLIGVTYSDQMRIILQYILDNWKNADRKPRVAFFYNDTAFGRSPVPAGRDYAKRHGIVVATEQIVALSALDATGQLKVIKESGGVDYIIINETAGATATIVRDARRLGITLPIFTLNWGVDETVAALTGRYSEGLLGAGLFAAPQEKVAGIAEIFSAVRSLGRDTRRINFRYVQGWVTAKILLAGIEKAGPNPTGEKIRKALETMGPQATGGVTGPVIFGPRNHAGASRMKIYQIRNGRWEPVTEYIEVRP